VMERILDRFFAFTTGGCGGEKRFTIRQIH
jgi:hypothetical protein